MSPSYLTPTAALIGECIFFLPKKDFFLNRERLYYSFIVHHCILNSTQDGLAHSNRHRHTLEPQRRHLLIPKRECPRVSKTIRAQRKGQYKKPLNHSVRVVSLTDLDQGWKNPKGDAFFQKQRRNADKPSEKNERFFYDMMKKIGKETHECTGAFRVRGTNQPNILDMCMAPGGFLATALSLNPSAQAVGFSLPSQGGHKLRLPADDNSRVTVKFLDLTMLAADMGVSEKEVPPEHADAQNFHLTSQFSNGVIFDLVLCDGNVLRIHDRPAYRERREVQRLQHSQLALGLERVREGGTMVVLLHKVESWDSVQMLYTFRRFSRVRVFKPRVGHTKRSSFYMIAKDIRVGFWSVCVLLRGGRGCGRLLRLGRRRDIWKCSPWTSQMFTRCLGSLDRSLQD